MSKRQRKQTQPPSATTTVYADIVAVHREIGIVSTVNGAWFKLPFEVDIPQGRRVRIVVVDAEGNEGDHAEESGTGAAGDHAGVSASA